MEKKKLVLTKEEDFLTKEEKVLWATWMASTDIWNYAVDIVLDFDRMMYCERARIWDEGLHIIPPSGLNWVVYPMKDKTIPNMIVFEWSKRNPNKLLYEVLYGSDVRATLERIVVNELKRIGFSAPWVSGLDVKRILIDRWGKDWENADIGRDWMDVQAEIIRNKS